MIGGLLYRCLIQFKIRRIPQGVMRSHDEAELDIEYDFQFAGEWK